MALEVEEADGVVRLVGEITDEVDFSPVLKAAGARATVDLRAVRRMNSSGVRCWVRFAHEIPPDVSIELAHCPVFFFKQITMIRNFLGRARLKSLFLPMVCEECEEESEVLVETEGLQGAPAGECAECGGRLELDEAEEVFASFLKELRP